MNKKHGMLHLNLVIAVIDIYKIRNSVSHKIEYYYTDNNDRDINNYKYIGLYSIQRPVNTPWIEITDEWVNLLVLPINANPDFVCQLLFTANTRQLYYKSRDNAQWGAWVQIV